jgi:ribulose-phosphate 3-epimerase
VHAEAGPHLDRSLQMIRALARRRASRSIPSTPASVLKHVLDRLDLVLVMTVNPGFGGQAFIPAMLDKISEVREMVRGRNIDIEVDGGVTRANAADVARAGANVLVAGSAIFKAKSYADEIRAIRTAATSVEV